MRGRYDCMMVRGNAVLYFAAIMSALLAGALVYYLGWVMGWKALFGL